MLPGCMSAWKKPSRNTWVKKIVTPSRASFGMSTPASRRRSTLADRHAVHALHHDHARGGTVPVHLRDQHQVEPCHVAAQLARRWRPRAPGRARRAGTCRTRPPPRAASGACRRRDSRSTQPRHHGASARGPSSITAQHAGPQHLDRDLARRRCSSVAKCTCAIEALATGVGVEAARRPRRPAGRRRARWSRRATAGRERRHPVLQLGELVGDVGRQQVAPGRQHLAELDEDRPQASPAPGAGAGRAAPSKRAAEA